MQVIDRDLNACKNMAYLTDLEIKGESRDPAFCLTGTPVDDDETA